MKTNLSILIIMLLVSQRVLPRSYYFDATLGHDTATVNSINTPWQTITKLNNIFSTVSAGDSILFKRGETWSGAIGGTIMITRSGSPSLPIVIGAYGTGNKPVISGYKELTFTPSAVSDVYTSNELLAVKPLNLLTVNDVLTGMGRFPNAGTANGGYLTVDSHVGLTQITDSSLSDTPNWTGGQLVRRAVDWVIDRNLITRHSGDTINYVNTAGTHPATDKFGYFIQNDSLTLDINNEWFASPSDTLKMYHTGGPPSHVKVASVSSLLTSSGYNNITIENIYFTGSNDTAIYVRHGHKFIIRDCVVNGAMTGIITTTESTSIMYDSIVNCLNNGIISVIGENGVIAHNYIHNVYLIPGAGGIRDDDGMGIISKAHNTIIRYNTIINMGCGGISFHFGNNVIIEYNLIDTFNVTKHDIGGIYTFAGDSVTYVYGRKIRYNIVLNGIGAGLGTADSTLSRAYGIYCDLGSFGGDVENNTVANCKGGIFIHMASNWNIRNNDLYNNSFTAIQINHESDTSLGRFPRNCDITGNIMWSTSLSQQLLTVSDFKAQRDIDLIGIIDSNYYISPLGDTGLILDFKKKLRSLPSWQSAHSNVSYDIHSSLSPLTFTSKAAQDSSVRFEYNATNADTTISLDGYSYIGADGVKYLQNVNLKPFTSIILIRDTNTILLPLADAYVHNRRAENDNYGTSDSLVGNKNNAAGKNRYAYLKFSLTDLSGVLSAKLRVYGKNNSTGK